MVGKNMSLKNPVTPPAIDPRAIKLVAQHLNHYATPGPKYKSSFGFIPEDGSSLSVLAHQSFS
jgi:hypothetical protein